MTHHVTTKTRGGRKGAPFGRNEPRSTLYMFSRDVSTELLTLALAQPVSYRMNLKERCKAKHRFSVRTQPGTYTCRAACADLCGHS